MYVMAFRILLMILAMVVICSAQIPPIEPGVSHELAKWRSARYSDVRYKLDLTLEKMSPVLKGTIEIRVNVGTRTPSSATTATAGDLPPIILDWRKIRGHEEKSTISNLTINGKAAFPPQAAVADGGVRVPYEELNEHLIFREGVVIGENVIKLDLTSPILTSGSAITRYIDKEDGSEYIYSLFVPSDASTAFPVFDQPDLKARFTLTMTRPESWKVVSNTTGVQVGIADCVRLPPGAGCQQNSTFTETKPISTYVFAFAVGPFEEFDRAGGNLSGNQGVSSPPNGNTLPTGRVSASEADRVDAIYVRKSQAAKFKTHAAEVFRLNREAVKYFEQYFDYKFPFPKYDLVLIPEFPFGGMEHAGATFLRESSIIFPQEPTKNDYISRATVIFHEAAHQWFGDTVTMRWFDDLWLKEGFATFTAYKAMERVIPEYNAWKVFYERVKQVAYQTDSTKGTTPIYQEIKNLSAAKSAYGAIVYNKAPAFLRQAEFYLGEEKFQTAVRAFLKKHEFGNATWQDLVGEFEDAGGQKLQDWAKQWVTERGAPVIRRDRIEIANCFDLGLFQTTPYGEPGMWRMNIEPLVRFANGKTWNGTRYRLGPAPFGGACDGPPFPRVLFAFPNYRDYGYGIFLLDPRSRNYVLRNIGKEKDDFLRTMMWGALWDSVREAEMDPREYVELVVKNIKLETDESTIQTLLGRVSTAMRYYIDAGGGASAGSLPPAAASGISLQKPMRNQGPSTQRASRALANGRASASDLQARVETLLIDRMKTAPTPGQKITYYRAFLNLASSENARRIMKQILKSGNPTGREGVRKGADSILKPTGRVAATTKDKFDIVQRLIILGDPEASKLLAELERTETSDDAKRYAYAAKAGFATAENKAKFWNDFVNNKEISESWIEAAFGPFNNIRHRELTLPYLEQALEELPNHKRNRKIFFVNGWLGAFIGGQNSAEALVIVNKFLADHPDLDNDLRLKILENVDLIERAVKIRGRNWQR